MKRSRKITAVRQKDKLLLVILFMLFALSLIPILLAYANSFGLIGGQSPTPGYLPILQISVHNIAFLSSVALLQLTLTAWLGWRATSTMRRLERAAMLDSLSGLPNRRALRSEMAQRIKRDQIAAIAFIDLDAFKAVNDTFGHDVGDSLIRRCSSLIVNCCDADTMVARIGGDEFAVFLSGWNCESRLEQAVRQLLMALTNPLLIDSRSLHVGASIGLASCSGENLGAAELMRRADLAMYASKRAGKMCSLWFDPSMNAIATEAREIAESLRLAIDHGEIQVFYQPIVGARTESIECVEALVRWLPFSDQKVIPPSVFIPIAEEAGLIERLGLLVLEKACHDAAHWPELRLTVNVSTAQLRNPAFPCQVKKMLKDTGFDPARLELELTESLLVQDPNLAKGIMAELRKVGVKFSLDDFGTGFASIGFLRQFEFETLKLDRSLVKEAETSEAARALVNASISIADVLGMNVTAEGIETRLQADLMRVAGCKHLQGWLFAKPMPSEHITRDFIELRLLHRRAA